MVLDDFQIALDRLLQHKLERLGSILSDGTDVDFSDVVRPRQIRPETQSIGLASPDQRESNKGYWKNGEHNEHIDLERAVRTDPTQSSDTSTEAKG